MLQINQLNVSYGSIQALRDLSLSIEPGQIVSLIGSNGAGKSTLMMTIAGVIRQSSGEILFEGEVLDKQAYKVLARGIGLVPERRRLYANLTVKENLLMGAFLRKDNSGIKADLERMAATFPIIAEREKQLAGTLSGGEQQMVAIARGLMSRPKLLMLDEPSLGLAPMIIDQVFSIIREIRAAGTTIFMTEQNAVKALENSDYAYVIESGQNVIAGSGGDLLKDETVRNTYLGIRTQS